MSHFYHGDEYQIIDEKFVLTYFIFDRSKVVDFLFRMRESRFEIVLN
jgi:hypothetical protein